RLDLEGARRAIAAVGEPLGLGVEEAAHAILAVVNTRMAGEIRLITLEQGHDPREFALVAFGGAGPLHGAALLRDIGIRTMLVPRSPGVLCAIGCAVADLRHDFSLTIERLLPEEGSTRPDQLDVAELHRVLAAQREEAEAELAADGIQLERAAIHHHLDMAYEGQVHRLRVAIEHGWEAPRLRRAFVEHYEREYGTVLGDLPVVVVNARTSIVGSRPRAGTGAAGEHGAEPRPRGERPVHFGAWIDTPVYRRADLRPGAELDGPLIVEQADTTVVVEPGMSVRVDAAANLVVTAA
ncbi:MAG: hydantoinase/oxoprolinase family protein, partial [Solirubrobacteraceae bacterium]